jgi:isopenicillin-N epimerase
MAAFLSVPAAIEFQKNHHWDEVRDLCHELALDAQRRICEITGLAPLHSQPFVSARGGPGSWFRQMFSAPLPAEVDVVTLKNRLYEEYRIEVPVHEWNGNKLIRVSVQGYNTRRDIDTLCNALSVLLKERSKP